MRAKQGALHIVYTWIVAGLAVWQLAVLLPALELDSIRELLVIVLLGVMAECLAVPFTYGRLSGAFVLVLSTFLIYGPAAAAWVSGLATLFGQGIANRGNPVRTVLFNAGQYVLALVAADWLFRISGGVPGLLQPANILPLVVFTAVYIAVNHILVYIYLLPNRHSMAGRTSWLESIKWDLLTYLFAVPLGLLIAMIYGFIGLSGILLLFFSILALQLILRFYVRLQVTNRELTAFYKVAKILEGKPDTIKIMEQILENAMKAVPFSTGVAYLCPEEGPPHLPVAVTGPYSKELMATAVQPGEGVVGLALESREPEIIFDTKTHALAKNEQGLCQALRSLIIIPMFSGSEPLGVIVLGEKRPMVFEDKHLHIMTVLAGQAAVTLENYVLKRRLSQALAMDTLTGLLNYDSFSAGVSEMCESSLAEGSPLGLILVNIDRFKTFNRRYGREAGEMALIELAALISGSVRKGDAAARYGGDEFAMLLPRAGGTRLIDLAETLLKRIRSQVFLQGEGRSARITVSIGMAEFPRDAGDPPGLITAAQKALDKAKENGGDRAVPAALPLVDWSQN
jgi:diguanylate cyclase (GGDEF)-like protein